MGINPNSQPKSDECLCWLSQRFNWEFFPRDKDKSVCQCFLFPRNCFEWSIWVGGQYNLIRFMNLSIMIRVAQHRNWFRKRPRRSWLSWLQSVLAMEIEVHIEPCRYGLLCDQINDLWTKDWFWTMINQLQTKKLWWALTPLKWLYAMKSKIDEYFLKVNGSMKLMDLDEISLKKLNLSKSCLRQSSKSWLR
jgi:hypothetical protein